MKTNLIAEMQRACSSAANSPRKSVAAAIFLAALLTACGGGSHSAASNTPAAPGAPGAPGTSVAAVANRTLLIDLDGVTYSALQTGIQNGSLPNLAKLQVQLAYSGGTPTASQPNLDTPGWATLLSGAWSDRTQVSSDVANQAIQAPTIFDIEKAANAGSTGAAVSSSGLVQLLSPQQNDGALTTLTDCSQNAPSASCVTSNAVQMISSGYTTVVAQYHSAEDALTSGAIPGSTQYASALEQLDVDVGQLIAATANTPNWLVVVTGNHGLSAAGQYDALNLLPESTTFIAMNQTANNGTAGVNAAIPSALSGLYAYEGTTDVAPTLLSYLNLLPAAANYTLDGSSLVNAQPVSSLTGNVTGNGTISPAVVLNWTVPASGAITIFRDGVQIATLPAGTTTYTDSAASSDSSVTGSGTFPLNYVVEAATVPTAILVPVQYQEPAAPLTSVLNGLVNYYPFDTLTAAGLAQNPPTAPLDAICTSGATDPICLSLSGTPTPNSSMGEFQSDISANLSQMTDPWGGSHAMMVDETVADSAGYDGYKLTPASVVTSATEIVTTDAIGQAIANCAPTAATSTACTPTAGKTAAFTIGFWFKGACSNTNSLIFGNKTNMGGAATNPFASTGGAGSGGASNGIIFSTWPITTQSNPPVGTTCGFNNNIGDGTTRIDVDSSSTTGVTTPITTNPYTAGSLYQAFTQNQWVYVAMVVNLASTAVTEPDGTSIPAFSMSSYVFNPSGTIPSSLVQKSYSAKLIKYSLLTGAGNYGIGEDGSGRYHLYTNGETAGSYTVAAATSNKPTQVSLSDLGMWNRALSASELQSIAHATSPLSSLMTPSP
jgi:hypothetical protein